MRRAGLLWIRICMILAVFPALTAGAERQGAVIEEIDSEGRINWSKWVIYVTELGNAEASDSLPFSNLFSTIQKVRIDASTEVSDLIQQGSMVCNQLRGMIRQAEVVKRGYLSNGAVELTLAFDMKGGFAQLALPSDIQPVPQIKTLGAPAPKVNDSEGPSSTVELYTGLILDARGLSAKPAISPKIVSEGGDEVYGPTYVSREFAVQRGMAHYTACLESGKASPRAGHSPLLVRALRTEGMNRCNFVISNADADEIRGGHANLRFLKECQVTIVIDPPQAIKTPHAAPASS